MKLDHLRTIVIGMLIAGTAHLCFGAAGDGSLADTNIKYFGRWDQSGTAAYHGYWGGAYLKVKFTGTTIKINLGNTLTYHAKIDNSPWLTFTAANGTNYLTASPLTQGIHTLIVVQAKDYAYDFAFKGLVLDPGATTIPPDVRTDLIEWIGDSITDGYLDARGDVSDYAWVCSESLGCEHTQIAYPGIALVDGYGQNTIKTGMSTQYFKLQDISYGASVDWDSTKYAPKIIVINIGTNDGQKGTPVDLYLSTYVTFLEKIRTRFPATQLFVMVPHTGYMRAQDSLAYLARVAGGDAKIHYINATGWLQSSDLVDGVHPTDAGQIKLAGLLEPLISPYLTPVSTSTGPIARDKQDAAVTSGTAPIQESFEIVRPDGTIARHLTNRQIGTHELPAGMYLVRSCPANGFVRIRRLMVY
jgi:lysophospholipase L1-like esterase